MPKPTIPTDRSKVDPNMPMRLDVAGKLAFPDGSIGVSALRTEIRKGRLDVMHIAGRYMVTLAAIDVMVERCRVIPTVSTPASPQPLRRPLQPTREERFAIAQAAALERVRGRQDSIPSTKARAATARAALHAAARSSSEPTAAERERPAPRR